MSPAMFQRLSHGSWSELSLARQPCRLQVTGDRGQGRSTPKATPTSLNHRDTGAEKAQRRKSSLWQGRLSATADLQPATADFQQGTGKINTKGNTDISQSQRH